MKGKEYVGCNLCHSLWREGLESRLVKWTVCRLGRADIVGHG